MSHDVAAQPLTLDQARATLEDHVRTTWWRRRGAAEALDVSSFTSSGAWHVVLESFTEKRTIAPAHKPYRGDSIDWPDIDPAPDPWGIQVQRPPMFTDAEEHVPLPRTTHLRTCHGCHGRGLVRCASCAGSGHQSCSTCNGRGHVQGVRTVSAADAQGHTTHTTECYVESCRACGGDGRNPCLRCHGRREVTCSVCDGERRLLHYQQLTVRWSNHVHEAVLERTDLPDDQITRAPGTTVLYEEDARVEPGTSTGAAGGVFRGGAVRVRTDVNAAVNRLITAYGTPAHLKVLRQRLTVRGVPVYEARYAWGKEERRFWIYGTDRRVYAPRYPLSRARIGAVLAPVVLAFAALLFAAMHVAASRAAPVSSPHALRATP